MSSQNRFDCTRLYPLEQLIEVYRTQPPLTNETLRRIGGLVLADRTTDSGKVPINEEQYGLVVRAAAGDTTIESAQRLNWEEDKVIDVKEQLLALHRVPAMSAVINQTILSGRLPVTVNLSPDGKRRFDPKQELVCEAICVGIPNNRIGSALGLSKRATAIRVMAPLARALEANGRTNCVYQAYSLGYKEIPKLTAS